jgi:electron transport complex protein RnfG
MSEVNTIQAPESTSSMKMLRAMVGIGIACASLIVFTYEGTLPRIERLRAEALEQAIFKVLPGITETATFQLATDNTFEKVVGEADGGQLVYAGYDSEGKLSGVAITASGQGYADILRILYGYNPTTQKVVGFYVLESKETPGLGDKIEKDDNFLSNFEGLDVSLTDDLSKVQNIVIPVKNGTKENPWEVDGITGATISSRAIGNIIGASTEQLVPLIYNNQGAFVKQQNEKTE